METAIGSSLKDRPRTLWFLAALGVGAVGLELLSAAAYPSLIWHRWQCSALVALVYGFVEGHSRGEHSTLGLRMTPRQGWGWWVKAALLIGAVLAALLGAVGLLVFILPGYGVPESAVAIRKSSDLLPLLLSLCVDAPLTEEIIYRLALGAPLVALVGPRATIVIGGLSFAVVHALWGVQSPENLLGGFILMWALLKSETLLVPIALHSAGNACAFAWQVGYWLWAS